MRMRLMAAGALGLMMAATAQVQADDAHYNDPSSICFRACMRKPPNCWDNDTGKVCAVRERTCAKTCNYSLSR